MKKFIQKSGIATAMIGILNVLPETKLFHRLKKENRILKISSGKSTDFFINFIPKSLTKKELIEGYKFTAFIKSLIKLGLIENSRFYF